jgi:hypothetical protein
MRKVLIASSHLHASWASLVLLLLTFVPVAAQTPGTDEETVRRIVENAMAAISLAEARAAQTVARIQIELDERDSELRRLRARLAAAEDSSRRQVVLLNRARNELDELRTRHDELHLRAALLEKTIEEERRRGDLSDTAQREKAALEEEIVRLTAEQAVLADSFGRAQGTWEAVRLRLERERDLAAQQAAGFKERSAVLEEALRRESGRLVALEAAHAELADSFGRAQGVWDAIRLGMERERDLAAQQAAGFKGRSAVLEEALKRETARAAAIEAAHAALRDSAGRSLGENERQAAEMAALRREIAETLRVVEESAVALRQARHERNVALARLRPESSSDAERILERRLQEQEIEIAALRAALLAAPGTSSTAITSTSPSPAVAPPPSPAITRPDAPVPSVPGSPAVDPSPPMGVPPEPVIAAPPPVPSPPTVPIRPPTVTSLDLDRASYEEMAAIEEIGPTRARALVWFRENIRPIRTEEDLKSVPGFNDERIEMFRAIWRPKENTP